MELDVIIKNGLLVLPETGITQAALAIKDGRIVGICEDQRSFQAKQIIDAQGNYILPGVVQAHAHLGRLADLEDYATESRSAAVGGVTTLIEFHKQSDDYATNFTERVKLAGARSYVDFSFHFHIGTEEQREKIPTYLELGVSSFKFIMTDKGGGEKGEAGYNDGLLHASLARLQEFAGTTACIHAENKEIIAYYTERLRRQGRDDLRAWSEAHPPCSEAESINRVLYFGAATKCPLYIVHMTTEEGLQLIREHRKKGSSVVYAETCPQYLTHTMDDDIGRTGKFTPPLQAKADNDALWEGLASGDIDAIGVDQITRQVDREDKNIWERSNTPREAATALAVLISEGFHKRGLSMEMIAQVTAANPARIFNLYPRKGSLSVGSDADLAIVDVQREQKVSKELIQSASNFSIYEGWTLKGWPILTMCRGHVVMRDGAIVGDPGWGAFLARRP